MSKTEWVVVIMVTVIMVSLLFPIYNEIVRDRSEDVTYSELFVIERADYLQGGFFTCSKTIITTDTGTTIVLNGMVLVPESGVEVMTRRDSSGIVTIVKGKK